MKGRMFITWLRWLFTKRGVWAGIVNRTSVVYWEEGRKMTIAGEVLVDGFEIYVASIIAWDDGELIDDSERQRILQNVKRSLESQGARVVLG